MSNAEQFLDPGAPIDQHKRRLPHWQQKNTLCFVTWHMADSMPSGKLAQLMEEKDAWLARHPHPWDILTESEYHRLFFNRVERWLDKGHGLCVLRDRSNGLIVSNALLHFDHQRYSVDSFVVMPNHVHLLFSIYESRRLDRVIQSLKGYTGKVLNKKLGKKGRFWHDEYWDRLIRNDSHLFRCREYIRNNPAKVKLACDEYLLYQDGAIVNPL